MLKVYRPICPDTFRLAHDISPDILGDDDCDTDFKIKEFISETYGCWYGKDNSRISDNDTAKDSTTEKDSTAEKNAKNLLHIKGQTPDYINPLPTRIEDVEELTSKELSPKKTLSPQTAAVIQDDYEEDTVPSCISYTSDVHIYSSNESNRKLSDSEGTPAPEAQNGRWPARRPRKLPEIPKKHRGGYEPQPAEMVRSLADELKEAIEKEENDDVFTTARKPRDNILEKYLYFSAVSRNTRTYTDSDNQLIIEDSSCKRRKSPLSSSGRGRKNSSDEDGSKRDSTSSTSFVSTSVFQELEVTHRGMHRFIPRHADEITIEIGDPIHVIKESDDLWCEGVNLRTGQKGIFPAMYATDLTFLEEESDEEDYLKFTIRFLGSVEVNYHKGDEVLSQAINKVAIARRTTMSSAPPPMCTMEISQYGIRMIDKSKEGHESDAFSHFFALKNISYCGTHPRNNKYFAFITKHPKDSRYACHVFLGERTTHSITDALSKSFKRFYQEYMAFSHPTEDIYLE
ncbi:JNK-interacting protein 1-like [Haliotis cracherodii]|uniref:JNK-interacting protein 1-like n=1 Tax=Haliotis cracherodii TaxID=6455 RepID=UPI0039E8B91F